MKYVVCGDFNIHLEKIDDKAVKKFMGMLKRHGLSELVKDNTRDGAHLDLVITNFEAQNAVTRTTPPIESDHWATITELKVVRRKTVKKAIQFRPYASMDFVSLGKDVIETFSVPEQFDSMDNACSSLVSNHLKVFDKHAPVRTKTIKACNPVRLSRETKDLKQKRDRLYARFKKADNRLEAKRELALVNYRFRKSFKMDASQSIAQHIREKGIWKVKDKLLERPQRRPDFTEDELNAFFASVSNEPFLSDLPPKPKGLNTSTTFTFRTVSTWEVLQHYNSIKTKMKKAPDSTGLSPIMLSYSIHCPFVLERITDIVNRSLLDCVGHVCKGF
jgi:hypothetical protein